MPEIKIDNSKETLDKIIEDVVQRTITSTLMMQNDLAASTSQALRETATMKFHSFNKQTIKEAVDKIRKGNFSLKPV